MGKHFNPGNEAFAGIIKSTYVDKTGLIDLINDTIGKPEKLTCISRPRRFGKSFAAQMLCAYYDCTCDSHELFAPYEISQTENYEKHINKYNVIALDITGFISTVKEMGGQLSDVPSMISADIRNDLIKNYPQLSAFPTLNDCLLECVKITQKKFIFILDEWDSLIREARSEKNTQEAYLNFLRGLFKNNDVTPYVTAAAYMTGILPIKKEGTESAVSDFQEYSILDPDGFARYTGFTEDEVRAICRQFNMDFDTAKQWYDGYSFDGAVSIYNPYSVMTAIKRKKFRSYWKNTSAADALETYINMNYKGLQEDVIRLISGEKIEVKTDGFNNDVESFRTKDDVLTLMIHLGYLAYDEETKYARIPNKEVKNEFVKLLESEETTQLAKLIQNSKQLLLDTFSEDEDAVASAIDKIRLSQYAPQYYNNEQALRAIIKYAYIICVDQYMKIEEMTSGRGIADVVYIPKKNSPKPALVIELKWNGTKDAAISQIKEKNYPAVINDYGGDILLVGINYSQDKKTHSCKIEIIHK